MKTIIISLLLISLNFFSFNVQAVVLDKLGQRLSSCQNLENDDYKVVYASALQKEAKNMFTDDKLETALVAKPDCFRVGTEIQLDLAQDLKPHLGRGLIDKIHVLTKSELLNSKANNFTKAATKDFVRNNPSKRYGILKFKVTQKVGAFSETEQYKRLPTCFAAYSDWESLRLKDENVVKEIQSGKRKGLIWNGTFNCYKIGVFTEIIIPRETAEVRSGLGYIIPTELHVVHYSDLNDSHASLLGESVAALKKKMAENKELEGGYVTMVGFDYQELHPKDIVEEQGEKEVEKK